MKMILAFTLIMSMGVLNAWGQGYSLYSNEKISIESEYLQEPIELNLHLPETHSFSAKATKYPITIIFDSQHERTYPIMINSIDLLTSETQIPESIIVGVPFNFQNRLYFTSSQKRENDSISGIERMEYFIFNELIPKLQNNYKGNEYISLIGHSRTGFLVNYLAFRKSSQINLAVSLSGFFNNEPLSLNTYYNFLSDTTGFSNKFSYYYTAGTSLEEAPYLTQFKNLDSLLNNKSISKNLKIEFSETPNANHITNYWISLPPILVDVFSDYNSILDNWFHDKIKTERNDNPVQQFEDDLNQAGLSIGTTLNPNLTHIYSLASLFVNDQKDYKTAIEFFELGVRYYPEYIDFYIDIIEYSKMINNVNKIKYYKSILRNKAIESSHLSSSEKEEILEFINIK